MALYRYVKKTTSSYSVKKSDIVVKKSKIEPIDKNILNPILKSKKIIKIKFKYPDIKKIISPNISSKLTTSFSLLFIASGIGMLFLVFWPMLSWQLSRAEFAPESKIIRPLANNPQKPLQDSSVLAKSGEEDSDMTKASNWFPSSMQKTTSEKVKQYTISIPKLKIENALVLVGGEDLTKSLIDYGGTAIPGEYGNAVIFGHSVLPEFFNPKDYHTIFATLPDLKVGDEIYTTVDGVKYKYVIYDFKTVDPTDVSVLEQHYDNYYLSLITCVPPGLKFKRLVAKAKIEPFDEIVKEDNKSEASGN